MSIILIIACWVLSMLVVFSVAWHFGKHEGVATEKYRHEAKIKMDNMPYSGLFAVDDPEEASKLPPIVIRVKTKGKWAAK